MRMRSGRLRYTVEFQEPVDTPDDRGGQTRTWNTVLTRRCNREDQSGRLFHTLHQRFAQMTHLFTLRAVDIDEHWRVLFEGQPHRIVSVIEIRNRQIQMITETESSTRTYGH